ncbi:MAG: pilus assembly protein CpaE [Micrococcaceae bacterium]|nr:pilus assembly protein CpaE [Micrococcaceae bacterium]
MSRYLLVTPDPTFVERLSTAISGELAGGIQQWSGAAFPHDTASLFSQQQGKHLPEVVLLGPGVPPAQALDLAAAVDRQYPGISVLLVHPHDHETTVAAMRAGVRDVLDPTAEHTDITALLHRAVQAASHRRSALAPSAIAEEGTVEARVISVLSPKGGAGKTTIATNLAVGLAALAPHNTVLVDLDLQFGDVAHALQLNPEQSVAEAVRGAAPRDTMVLKSYLSAHPTGLYVLCAPASPAAEADITAQDVAHLLEQLASQYRYVVVDSGAGLSEHTLSALDRSTDYLFVAGMDVPSIRGLRKELDVLKSLGMVAPHQHVVLNSADPRDGLSLRDVEAALGQKVDVVVPFRRDVRLSTNRGIPLLQSGKRDPATRELRKLLGRFAAPGKPTAARGVAPRPAKAVKAAVPTSAPPPPAQQQPDTSSQPKVHQQVQPQAELHENQGQREPGQSKRLFTGKRLGKARHRKGTP